MSNYRRIKNPGGLFFFTVVTYRRQKIFDNPKFCTVLRESIINVRNQYPFNIEGWVLMPDHMHCIWQLPGNDHRNSIRWGLIKAGFSRRVKHTVYKPDFMNISKSKRRESTIWQRRYWEHQILDEDDYINHMNYIHYNPVKHGLVRTVKEWPNSTFHRFVKKGVYSENWGSSLNNLVNHDYGE